MVISSPTLIYNFRQTTTIRPYGSVADTYITDILPTAQDDDVVEVDGVQGHFGPAGVTQHITPETLLLQDEYNNEIDPGYFQKPPHEAEDRKTTLNFEDSTLPYSSMSSPFIQISISNADLLAPTPTYSYLQKPGFRPKPQKPSNYVLVPTISHTIKPNRTQEFDSIINIIQMLNESSTQLTRPSGTSPTYSYTTNKKPTSYIYTAAPTAKPQVYSSSHASSPTTIIRVPTTTHRPTKPQRKPVANSSKKPSSTVVTRRPATKPPKKTTARPQPSTTTIYTSLIQDPAGNLYSSSSFRPGHSTFASTPTAFIGSSKPPSTSYVFSPTIPKRPTASSSTPAYSPYPSPSTYGSSSNYPSSTYASPPPTIIVLGGSSTTESTIPSRPTPLSATPVKTSTTNNKRKPVTHVTINNHVTHNVYSSSERPPPTVLITPKPSVSSTTKPLRLPITEYYPTAVEVETSVNDLNNFPPVRNPNLNLSATVADDDITTPTFLEDEALNLKMESFVNKIVQSLQEPFYGLKDVVYNKNTSVFSQSTYQAPVRKTATKKPSSLSTKPLTTRKSTTKRPGTVGFTTKRTTIKRIATTVTSLIENELSTSSSDYRSGKLVAPCIVLLIVSSFMHLLRITRPIYFYNIAVTTRKVLIVGSLEERVL